MASPNIRDVLNISGANMAEKKKSKKFIQKATENAHGQFKAKAEAAGKSTKAFAEEKKDAPGKLGKQARLALALMGLNHSGNKKKSKTRSAKEVRGKLYGSKD